MEKDSFTEWCDSLDEMFAQDIQIIRLDLSLGRRFSIHLHMEYARDLKRVWTFFSSFIRGRHKEKGFWFPPAPKKKPLIDEINI